MPSSRKLGLLGLQGVVGQRRWQPRHAAAGADRTASPWFACVALASLALGGCAGGGAAPAPPAMGSAAGTAVDDDGTLDAFRFLLGTWRTAADAATGATTTETWLPARSGVMFGVGRVDAGGALRFSERLRIERREAPGCAYAYVAAPAGQAEVAFCLEAQRAAGATFVNRGHDFPQRIDYQRRGDALDAAIEGPQGGQTERRSWTFQRVR